MKRILLKFDVWVTSSSLLVGVIVCTTDALYAKERDLDIAGRPRTNVIQHDGKNCMELKDFDNWSVWVSRPGDYCVAQNLRQSLPIYRLPHQPVPMSPLIEIRSNDVTVDLMSRHLSAKIPSPMANGIMVYSLSKGPWHNISVGNGSIATSTRPTVVMVDNRNGGNKRFSGPFSLADYAGDISQYRLTAFVLENLTLEAESHVIIMQGMKNVIRNCKIIGGNGTVNLYGPNLVFENNEIILHAKDPKTPSDEPAVALYLEDAANSVVRNNRIVIEGRASKADAIVLKNSPNVLLEGNTIKGASDAYRLLDERSTVKTTGNTLR